MRAAIPNAPRGASQNGNDCRLGKADADEEIGINKNTGQTAQKVAEIPQAEVEAYVEETEAQGKEITLSGLISSQKKKHNHLAQGTGDNEWYTPEQYIDAARSVMGAIDLDPASSEHAQATVKAGKHYTINDSGLSKEWAGRVWLNPPYAQPHIHDFVAKLAEEYSSGRVTEAILLTHNYTDTRWFHLAAKHATAILFTRGRIGFEDPAGNKAAPTQGQSFFYYGDNLAEFKNIFGEFGLVVTL
jgi:phage N-6-adenine-methyltransferase